MKDLSAEFGDVPISDPAHRVPNLSPAAPVSKVNPPLSPAAPATNLPAPVPSPHPPVQPPPPLTTPPGGKNNKRKRPNESEIPVSADQKQAESTDNTSKKSRLAAGDPAVTVTGTELPPEEVASSKKKKKRTIPKKKNVDK